MPVGVVTGAEISGATGTGGAAIVVGTVLGAVGRLFEVARSGVGIGVVVGVGTTTWGSCTVIGASVRFRALTEMFGSERIAANAKANNAAVMAREMAKLGPRFSGVC
jgi:hypothetical protein